MLRTIININFFSHYTPLQLFQSRKLLYQHTSEALAQSDFLSKQRIKKQSLQLSVYCGYDPTADSLHLGNLVSIIMMARLHKLLHLRPIFLLGGATGLIGDPSGKKEERNLLAEQRVQNNLESIKTQITSIYNKISQDMELNSKDYGLSLEKEQNKIEPLFINNYEFYKDMSALTYLRDIGKVLRMNTLLQKQIVTNRLQSQSGISYTQFSYSILQAYDFYRLNRDYGCVLQFGGSDQWGNITNGCELTRKMSKGKLQGYGITMPLLLTKNGQKFGKSEGNALFLNNSKTPISHVYDYFYNTADDEIEKLLSIFTLYEPERISQIMKQQNSRPELRLGQKILAQKVTGWLGSYKNLKEQLMKAGQQSLCKKSKEQLEQIYECLPSQMRSEIAMSQLMSTVKLLPDLLVKLGLCKSKNEGRKDIEGDGIYINNSKVGKNYGQVGIEKIIEVKKLAGGFMLVRKGKKKYLLLKIIM